MPHVANIGEPGRRRRVIGGAVWLVIATITTMLLNARHARDGWYLMLLVPFTLAALGCFQARART